MASSNMHDDTQNIRPVGGHAITTLALASVLVLGLTACSSKPARVADSGTTVASASKASSPSSGTPVRRGGGYYLDDGPDDMLPEGLDLIPDAVPRIEPFHQPAFRPYTALGQQFVPRSSLTPFRERGHASWYGRRFHGNPTSTGEPYDMYAMTAAHPTLPLPSYARVTNLSNGRSVIVRINDRGPFLRGRVIDLSFAAAYRLGYVNAGSAMVEVESITHEDIRVAQARGVTALPGMAGGAGTVAVASAPAVSSRPAQPAPARALEQSALPPLAQAPAAIQSTPVAVTPSAEAMGGAYLQLAAFSSPDNADGLARRVRDELSMFADRLHLLKDGGRYRLQVGPFASADDARTEARRIGALLDVQPFVVLR